MIVGYTETVKRLPQCLRIWELELLKNVKTGLIRKLISVGGKFDSKNVRVDGGNGGAEAAEEIAGLWDGTRNMIHVGD